MVFIHDVGSNCREEMALSVLSYIEIIFVVQLHESITFFKKMETFSTVIV